MMICLKSIRHFPMGEIRSYSLSKSSIEGDYIFSDIYLLNTTMSMTQYWRLLYRYCSYWSNMEISIGLACHNFVLCTKTDHLNIYRLQIVSEKVNQVIGSWLSVWSYAILMRLLHNLQCIAKSLHENIWGATSPNIPAMKQDRGRQDDPLVQ